MVLGGAVRDGPRGGDGRWDTNPREHIRAIAEVTGENASYFSPGDWPALAGLLRGALSTAASGHPAAGGPERYSTQAAAERIAAAYAEVLVPTRP